MNLNKCQRSTHEEMNIITICFNKNCQGQRACCSMCLNEFHKDHNDQQVDLEYFQNYVYTSSQKPIVPSPMVDYSLQILTQVQKYIDNLSKLVKSEMDRLNSANLIQFSKDAQTQHNMQKDKTQAFTNQLWNQLAQDILSYVEVKNNKIIEQNIFLSHLGKVNFGMISQFQLTLRLIKNQIKQINQEHDLDTITESSISISNLQKENVLSEFHGHEGIVWRLVFSKNSKYLISGSEDQTVRVWTIQKQEQNLIFYPESQVRSIAISHDNTYLTSNSIDGNIKIWNFETKNLLCSQPAHSSGAGISFSNDPEIIVSSGYDGVIKLWGLTQLNKNILQLIKTFKAANNCIWTVLFSSDCSFIISICNKDSQILIQDSQTGNELKRLKSNPTKLLLKIVSVAVSKSSNLIAYGEDNSIVVWRKI